VGQARGCIVPQPYFQVIARHATVTLLTRKGDDREGNPALLDAPNLFQDE
jgi:hypothetical protein